MAVIDYLGVITKKALSQITRNNFGQFLQAEDSAEMSIIGYPGENCGIECELNKGKTGNITGMNYRDMNM